jgi:hypothetical protein
MIFDEDGKPYVAVYTGHDEHEAEIIASLLRAHDIEPQVNTPVPKSVYNITVDGLGEIEVMVRQNEVEEARFVIAQREELETTESDE